MPASSLSTFPTLIVVLPSPSDDDWDVVHFVAVVAVGADAELHRVRVSQHLGRLRAAPVERPRALARSHQGDVVRVDHASEPLGAEYVRHDLGHARRGGDLQALEAGDPSRFLASITRLLPSSFARAMKSRWFT